MPWWPCSLALHSLLSCTFGPVGIRKTVNLSPSCVFALCGCFASLPTPASHMSDLLASYYYTLFVGILLPSAGTLSAPPPLLAPSLLSRSPRWVALLAFFTRFAIYSMVATRCGYPGSWYTTVSLTWTTLPGAVIQRALRPCRTLPLSR